MHFSRALLHACLTAGKYLFLATGALALVSIASDWIRSDASGNPRSMILIAAGCLLIALLFWAIGRKLDRMSQ